MKIKTLTATFGKLRQQTLELEDGLNIIEAPNEAGKSTWAAFLRAMLYGIDTRERDRKGVIAEKNRYQPWEGGAMEGSAALIWQGREITLRRTGKANSPLSRFQAVYTGTEEPVPGLTADSVGEALTGVGREVFERSAFVGQSALAVTGSAELERRVCAIVSSGQEDVSFSEAAQRLREWKNRRQSNQKNGLIPRLEEEKAQVSAALERLEGANRQACAARARIRELEREKSVWEQELQTHRALALNRARVRYDEAKARLDKAQAELDAIRQERRRRGTPPDEETLRRMQGELSYGNTLDANIRQERRACEENPPPAETLTHPVFAGMEPAAARARAQSDADILQRKGSKLPVLVCVLAVLCLLLVQVFVRGNAALYGVLTAVCAAAAAGAALFTLLTHRKRTARKDRILAAYAVRDSGEIFRQAEEYIDRWQTAEQARTDAAVRAAALERLEDEQKELTQRLLACVHTFAPEVTDLYGVSAAVSLARNLAEKERAAALSLDSAARVFQAVAAQGIPEPVEAPAQAPACSEQEAAARLDAVRRELSQQNERLAMAQGEMNTLGEDAALQARLSQLNAELCRRREEYDAITAAMNALSEANAELQARLSPALNRRSGELFYRLTGGAYDQVSLTRNFEALASRPGDVTPRKILTLSKGTADQLYLAVRLAVCDLVLTGDDPAPLVLDDALVCFDDERLRLALKLLRELSSRRQILLFTCQSRERLCMAGAQGVHIIRSNK